MYTVLLVGFTKNLKGEAFNKSATVRVFWTEKEAKETLNELYWSYHLEGDKGYKFLKEFRIISDRSVYMSCWYGRVDFINTDCVN